MIKLLIADDHSYLIEGVKTSLVGSDIVVVAETVVSEEVLNAYIAHKPDVVLCDIKFGAEHQNGFDILEKVLAFDPAAKFIMFSQFDQDTLIQRSYDGGAKCFLMKTTKSKELMEAITQVSRGNIYFQTDIANRRAQETFLKIKKGQNINEIIKSLSDRELELWRLVAKGMTDNEIAEYFDVHIRTVTTRKTDLKDKLGINRNAEFTILAIKHNIINVDGMPT